MNFRRAQDVSPVGLRHPSVTPRARNCKGPTLAAVHLTFAESCSNDRNQLFPRATRRRSISFIGCFLLSRTSLIAFEHALFEGEGKDSIGQGRKGGYT